MNLKAMEPEFKGVVYRIGARWSFRIRGQCGAEFCRGSMYASKVLAQEEMKLLLHEINNVTL